jgi:sugar/nucleoside kinase (ribokinase family)
MRLLFIGRSTFDIGYVCAHFPREDEKLTSTLSYALAGGPALNAAVAARALGSEVVLATLLGHGPFAAAVQDELTGYGITIEDFASPGAALLPISSILVVQTTGSRTVIDQQRPQALARAVDSKKLLGGVGLVLTDGFLPELAVPVCREARRRGIQVVMDGGSWKAGSSEIMAHVDCAIVSERFEPGGGKVTDVLAAIHALGPAKAAVTRGERALSWSDGTQRGEIDPPVVDAVDTLGAGDIFHGAFCHFRAEGADFRKSLEQAAEVAAQSCRHYGTRAWIDEL